MKAKGQFISKQIYGVLYFSKMQRNIARISALKSADMKASQTRKFLETIDNFITTIY